jgi:hypothetical protein
VGGPYRFWGKHTLGAPGPKEATQTITRLVPSQALSFRWRIYGVETEVNALIAPKEEGSTLSIRHRLDSDLGVTRQKELLDDLIFAHSGFAPDRRHQRFQFRLALIHGRPAQGGGRQVGVAVPSSGFRVPSVPFFPKHSKLGTVFPFSLTLPHA